jgi:hypothetical protein
MRTTLLERLLITCILIQNFGTKEKHLNKKYKRGDLIHEASSYRGSGSQTGPHIKSVFLLGADGKDLRDFDNPLNDPKPYLLYGKYVGVLIELI